MLLPCAARPLQDGHLVFTASGKTSRRYLAVPLVLLLHLRPSANARARFALCHHVGQIQEEPPTKIKKVSLHHLYDQNSTVQDMLHSFDTMRSDEPAFEPIWPILRLALQIALAG
jgi:hypothetical protein